MDINSIIAAYMAAKQQESDAKKRAAELKTMIVNHAAGKGTFTTSDYNVIIKTTTSSRLDTESLYRDFPDIKKDYGKTTTSTSVDIAKTAKTDAAA